jgi:hypothetical protein
MGLVSAYHSRYAEAQGRETRPTFFLYRHQQRPYHIDYCFLPTTWLSRIRDVTVGDHAAWASKSDHMPLTVDLGQPAPTRSRGLGGPQGSEPSVHLHALTSGRINRLVSPFTHSRLSNRLQAKTR